MQGKVIDNESHPLEFVNVSLQKDSLKIVKGISDEKGNFTIEKPISNTPLHLIFSLVGYKTVDTLILTNLGRALIIKMAYQSNQLREVSVSSKRKVIEKKIDRLVFNVENNINVIGSDGLDLLNKTPLVRADDNGGVKIVGKEGVEVMIDNKLTHLNGPALASLLKSISADNISKIEVITAPPAEYDAQGNGGLINIVTKKVKKLGYSGTFINNLTKDAYITSYQNLSLNYNFEKLLLFGNIATGHGGNGPTNMQGRLYNNQNWFTNNKNKEQSKFFTGSLGFDYLISKNTSIGISYSSSLSHPDLTGTSTTQVINKSTRLADSILNVDFLNKKEFRTQTANLHISQKLDTSGKTLVVDGDYFNNSSSIANNSRNYNTFPNGDLTSNPVNDIVSSNGLESKGLTFNTVITIPLKKSRFTFGNKLSFISSNNDVLFYKNLSTVSVVDSTNSNSFKYDENIQALFGSFNTQVGKLGVQAGLRGEATQYKGISPTINQTNKNSYFSLFPTVYLTYELNEKNTISLNYSRRIGRPYFSSLNPFRIYVDQYNYSTGNPYLGPSYTNSFELSNTFNHLLNTLISYSFTNNQPASLRVVSNGSNIQENIIGNFLSTKSFLIDNSMDSQPLKWLETSNEISLYYNTTSSSIALTQPTIKGFGGDFRSSNSISFNKSGTVTGGIDFTYQFPFTSAITKYHKYYYTDISSSFLMFNKKLQLTVAVRDIFKTKYVSSYSIINGIELTSRSNNDSRRFLLNLKYSFGNLKLKKGQSHNSSSTEQGRSGN